MKYVLIVMIWSAMVPDPDRHIVSVSMQEFSNEKFCKIAGDVLRGLDITSAKGRITYNCVEKGGQ